MHIEEEIDWFKFVNHGCAKLKETLMVERWYLDEIQWKCSSFGAPASCNVGDVDDGRKSKEVVNLLALCNE